MPPCDPNSRVTVSSKVSKNGFDTEGEAFEALIEALMTQVEADRPVSCSTLQCDPATNTCTTRLGNTENWTSGNYVTPYRATSGIKWGYAFPAGRNITSFCACIRAEDMEAN